MEKISSVTDYFVRLKEERRARPKDDLATVLSQATIDGKPLGHLEISGRFQYQRSRCSISGA